MPRSHLGKKDIFIELSPEELRKFHSILAEMKEATHKSWGKVVRNMARDVTRRMLQYTGIAPKTRSRKIKHEKRYWAIVKHRYTGEYKVFPVTPEQAEKYGYDLESKVKKRGFLKAGWVAALAQLGINVKNAQQYLENPKWGNVTSSGEKNNALYMMTVFQNVPFFTEWDEQRNRWKTPQHSLERAIRVCTERWEKVLQKYALKEIELKQGVFRSVFAQLDAEAEKIGKTE